ncbi:sensor domain-containing diguanylate cyclase [Niveibacterium sp. 24ML]|uniref:sensor domain-containing diguanylate cyclase n=1 Tax=Niveibacterium sp. 24ML TaxID=2985512 RepID=UPI0022715762|nr:sensor domain-containing diguanylate cyclase [Niveibacterium sp. 24ML]MCX9157489.1 sensor domain-containing diguanylate cyclase [Niveibacterium sp. 24ML]
MRERFSDPFLAEKYEQFRGLAFHASLFTPALTAAMWGWEWGVDPPHAMDTLHVRIAMVLLSLVVPLSVKLYARSDVGAWLAALCTVLIELLLCVVHDKITQGALLGMPGFMFFYLLAPVVSFVFPFRVNLTLNLALPVAPLVLHALSGIPDGFHVVAYSSVAFPAAAFVITGQLLAERAMRRFFEARRLAAWRSAAIDKVAVPVFVANSEGLVEYANAAMMSLLDQPGKLVLGQPLGQLLDLAGASGLKNVEARVRGSQRNTWLLLSGTPVGRAGRAASIVYVAQDVSAARAESDALRDAALSDTVTGLANRRAYDQQLERRHAQGSPFAVLFVDLDGFKAVNDNFGHDTGDALLKVVAQRLQRALRQGDLVARLGGDEFALLASTSDGAGEARALAERLIRTISEPIHLAGGTVQVGASVGVALAQSRHSDPRVLVRAADAAMYRAKGAGKGRVELAGQDEYA